MQNVLSSIQYVEEVLSNHNFDNSRFEAQYIVSHVINVNQNEVYLYKDLLLSENEKQQILSMLEERLQYKPLQYITGTGNFFAKEITVNSFVLIPRPETECLVMEIINDAESVKFGKSDVHYSLDMLDIGTGSGIIAISLKCIFPKWKVDAIDISEEALVVARSNSNHLQIDVNLFTSDIFDNVCKKYDIIVSNPPYISEHEYKLLHPEITEYEPRIALVAEENGLYFYRRILEQAASYLKPGGRIYFEIGSKQADIVKQIAADNGFELRSLRKDLNDYDRVLSFTTT